MDKFYLSSLVVRSVNEGVVVYDRDLKYLLWNPFMEEFTGLKESEVLGKHPLDLFPFLENEGVIDSIKNVLNGENTNQIEFKFKVPGTGLTGWASESTSPLIDDNNKIIGAISTVRDITENKLQQIQLKDSEVKYKVLFERANDAIFLMDKEIFIDCNLKTLEMFGCEREQIIGKPPYLFSPELQPDGRNSKDKALEKINEAISDKNQFFEWQHNRLDGTLFDSEVSLSNVHFAEKDYLLAIVRDITYKKLTENALKESEYFFKESQRAAAIGSYKTDFVKGIWESSEVLDQVFGIDQDYERSVESWLEIVYPDDQEMMLNYLNDEILLKHRQFNKEYRIIRKKDNEVRWVLGLGEVYIDENEKVISMIGTIQDITERKKFEEALIAAKEAAEKSEKLKTAFLQNISHEIRTPLNGILGFSDILTRPDISSDQTIEYTGIIKQSSKKLLEIINDILDISKIETDQVLIKKQVFSINDLFNSIYNFYSQSIDQKGIKFISNTNLSFENSFIESDKTKLNQILSNLINNAIKFTQNGSIEIGYNLSEKEIIFYVKDTGIGIKEEIRNRVFDRFYHYESSESHEYEGFGLGLSISEGLVKLLGGKIWFNSSPGNGSEFCFSIPYVSASQIIEEPLEEVKLNNGNNHVKILIAEDNYISYKYLYEILKNEHTTILYAKNGEQAIELVKKINDIDIVLMDIRMPVMDGKTATEIIKKIRPKLPVIANTAYAFSNEDNILKSLGFNDYISKPIEKTELFNLIEKHLKNK